MPPAHELRDFLRATLAGLPGPGGVRRAGAPCRSRPNGKIDRTALPAAGQQPARPGHGYQAPAHAHRGARSPASGPSCSAWTRSASPTTSSTSAATRCWPPRLVTRIRAGLRHRATSLAELFDHPTVAELAAVVEAATPAEQPRPDHRPPPATGKLPLSFAQQRLWFLDQLDPGLGRVQHGHAAPRCPEQLDVAALRAALDAVVERHEVLRTRLVADDDGVPRQIIDPPAPFELPVVDLAGEAEPGRGRAWLAA